MHCPKCGQQQISEETRFCSRCGFLLTGIAEVVATGGVIPKQGMAITGNSDSPRRRGAMQGLFIFLLAFLVVPILTIISIALEFEPYAVVISALLFGVGGLLRMAYALMFESAVPYAAAQTNLLTEAEVRAALPPSQSIRASAYASPGSSWRETNDLQREPESVTDSTTKLLQKDESDQ